MSNITVLKTDMPNSIKSRSRASGLNLIVARWCKKNKIKYAIVWGKGKPYYARNFNTRETELRDGTQVIGVSISEEDYTAIKLRWM